MQNLIAEKSLAASWVDRVWTGEGSDEEAEDLVSLSEDMLKKNELRRQAAVQCV